MKNKILNRHLKKCNNNYLNQNKLKNNKKQNLNNKNNNKFKLYRNINLKN